MKVSIHKKPIDEVEVEIHCREQNEDIDRLYKQINTIKLGSVIGLPEMFPAFKGNIVSLIKTDSIMLIFSSNKRVYGKTSSGEYEIKHRLFEIEEMAESSHQFRFIRVSNTDIVNFSFVKSLEMNLNGTIKILLKDDSYTFISRRYTNRVMGQLGVKMDRRNI